jgi:glycine/D-amino acid oxidase-like deaminating enzyme
VEPHAERIDAAAGVLADQGVATTEIAPDAVPERFPLLTADGVARAIHLDTGGVLLAGRIVELLAHHLAGAGVPILSKLAATAVDPEAGTVDLADGRRLEADRVVVAAGPWVGRLLPAMASRVTPSRQLVVYVAPPADAAAAWAEMPMVLDLSPERIFYVVPPVMGTGMKIGDHAFSMTGDPDRDREPGVEEARALFGLARERLAGIDGYHLDEAKTCFYTVEPEERFVVGPVGAAGLVMTGFSGHGFKFGPLMGEAAADVLDGSRPAEAVADEVAGRSWPRAAE